MRELRERARERMKPWCRVCPVCDGRVCSGEVPGMGGIGSGVSFRNNVSALAAHTLNMRVLHEASDPDTSLSLWGARYSLPVFSAPFGALATNLGGSMTDEEYTERLAAGCARAQTLAGVPDILDFTKYVPYMERLRPFARCIVPYIKPWRRDAVAARMDVATDLGCAICGMDVDAAGLPAMRKLNPPVTPKSPRELADMVSLAHERGMKFIVKGVMTVDEASIAADAGADAVLVSNHGGRVLDGTPGAAEVLPAIAEAVGGRVAVMVDGGIRTGADVLKVLALGATAALVCRPLATMIHGDGDNGVALYFANMREELAHAMRLTGCPDLASVDRRVLWK